MTVGPCVSVIVIVYNDAKRLPRAMGSVLGQSLRDLEVIVVDDASVDATPRIADDLAEAHPDRVRIVHLPVNSGGCGRPRNIGIDAARGTYVMFLDSDDTLDRHACRNMVAAAEDGDVDLVSGQCYRVYPDHGTEKPWYRGLYARRARYASVREAPGLLYDTLSTNKCYRRDFLDRAGLRFPVGLCYEDLLFTARAYLAARTIAVIPHRVYNWYSVEGGENRSITNRRAEPENFADRLEIHRRIDAAFADYGADDLRPFKDAKFLNHDLLLYMREMRGRNTGYRRAFASAARDYVAELDPRAFEESKPIPAVIGYLLLRGDGDAAVAAADYAPKNGDRPRLSACPVERDGRVYWSDRYLDTSLGRRVLDVTELGIQSVPWARLRLGGRVTALRRRGGALHIAGDVANPLGRIPADGLTGVLEFRERGTRRTVEVPALVRHVGTRIGWAAGVDMARQVRPLGFVDRFWRVRLRLVGDGGTVLVRLLRGPGTGGDVAVPARPRLTRLGGDHFRTGGSGSGELTFRLVARAWPGRAVLGALGGPAAARWGRRWRGLLRRRRRAAKAVRRVFVRRRTKVALFNRVLTRLPVHKGAVVFESHLGRQYSDSPRYIYEELCRSGTAHTATWSHAGASQGFPAGARLVRRGSWAYFLALARAEFWVDNQGFPAGIRKRPQTTYIQTWHGSAFKRMGLDEPRTKAGPRAKRRRLHRMVDRFDCFLVRSEHDVATLVNGLGVRAELLRSGYPRNDPLVDRDATPLDALRRGLGLTDGRLVVLYAPTFRAGPGGRPRRRLTLPFEAERFARELGDTHVMLVRPHYLNTVVLPPGVDGAVREATGVRDISRLLLLADVLVTDYSSVMFDYALLDRPMVFFVPDHDAYVRTRGGYFDLAAHAPGPLVTDDAGLLAALADPDALRRGYAERRRAFVEHFGEYDTGTAAKTVVERFFGGRR